MRKIPNGSWRKFKEAGVNLNYRNKFGETLLHTCLENALDGISEHSQEMALNRTKALIKAGVDLNILSRNGSLTRGAPPLNVALYYWDQNKNKNTSESAQSVRNSHEIIEALLEADIDLELTDQEGNTALHKAASTGNTEILNTLIKAGANIHATNNNGDTPLHLAIRKGNMEAARLLMRQTDLKPSTEPNNLDQQILFLAIEEGRIDFIEELLTHNTIDRNGKNENGETPLHIAIANGNIEVLKLLLNIEDEAEELTLPAYILVNEKSNYGETLLMCAVDLGSVRLVEMLLKHPNIDIDIRANKEEGGNNTAFMMALKEGNAEMIKVFVEASQKYDHIDLNINAELEDGKTALMLAAERGHGDCIRELLKHPDIDINKKDASGKTALMLAMKEGNVYNALDAFVEHKDIEGMLNETDNEGNTAFMIALEKGYSDSIRFFANRAGGINESIANGKTALMIAAEKGFESGMQALLKYPGIDLDKKDKNGNTALMLALKGGNKRSIKSFIDYLGGVNAVVEDGKTLLMIAAEKGYLRGIEVLLQNPGIDIKQKDPSGRTVIEIAAENKHFGLLPLLRKGA